MTQAATHAKTEYGLTIWPGLPLAGLAMALFVYLLLPVLGLDSVKSMFGLKRLLSLLGLGLGSLGYLVYLRFILKRPQWLVFFIVWGWAIVDALNLVMLEHGVNIHLRPLLLLALGVPIGWMGLKYFGMLWHSVPYLKYYALFFLWLGMYFLFYNAHVVDPTLGGESVWSEGSIGVMQLIAYMYGLLAIVIAAVSMLKVKNPQGLFDGLNKGLFLVTGLQALAVVVGYPFGLFSMHLDGFVRSVGFFSHPNPYAHHMGLLLVYMVGMFCYYQGPARSRMPGWLLLGSLGISLIAFLLGLSKTAMAAFAFCAFVLLVLNLTVPAVRRHFIPVMLGLTVLAVLGLWLFEAVTDNSFFALIEARMEQGQSYQWRTEVWGDLMAGLSGWWLLIGHGFTAANQTLFHLTYSDTSNAKPLIMVHNGYIALLYDLGIMGYLLFVAVLCKVVHTLWLWVNSTKLAIRPLWATILAMSLYFLMVCCFDEMTYMFDAPLQFWTLGTCLYCLALRKDAA